MMGREFINNIPRYCFWFYHEDISDLDKAKSALEHLKQVKEYRESSTAESTRKLAIDKPLFFAQISQPQNKSFIAVPKVSSSNRKYIPIGYLDSSVIVGDKLFIIPDGDLYTFSVLTSIVHNAWMRTVAGRLKSDYSYTTTVVYNTFPWIEANENEKQTLEELAQNILKIRNNYLEKGKSLADLYGNKLELLYSDLNKAHIANDKAVMALYGFKPDATEDEIVAKLMQMYAEKVKQ